jgi:hypothetical protein
MSRPKSGRRSRFVLGPSLRDAERLVRCRRRDESGPGRTVDDWASLMGNFTLVVAALSYAGQLNLTAVADRDACPDVEVFVQGVQATLNELEGSVLVSTS